MPLISAIKPNPQLSLKSSFENNFDILLKCEDKLYHTML